MTAWQFSGFAFGLIAYAVGWIWGGRPERFAAGVLIVACMVSTIIFRWQIGGFHLPALLLDVVRLLVFGWFSLRSDRWWPFVATASIGLMVFVQGARLVDPSISQYAVASADVGLGFLLDLALLLGACERRLAGETRVAPSAWNKAALLTAKVRGRQTRSRSPVGAFTRPGAIGAHAPAEAWPP
jgi:hypothetical protein